MDTEQATPPAPYVIEVTPWSDDSRCTVRVLRDDDVLFHVEGLQLWPTLSDASDAIRRAERDEQAAG